MAGGVKVHCLMASTETQVYEDEHVILNLQVYPDGVAQLLLHNKSASPVDVDRAHSFAYVNDQSFTLYTPGQQTETHTKGFGVIDEERFPHEGLTGTRYFRGESHSLSRTEEDIPMQAVAPGGTAVIYEFASLPSLLNPSVIDLGRRGNARRFGRRGHFINPQTGERHKFRHGDARVYAEENTPLRLAAYVQYHLEGSADEPAVARISDYVRQVVVGGESRSASAFSFRSGGGNALLSTEIGLGVAVVAIMTTAMGNMSSSSGMDF